GLVAGTYRKNEAGPIAGPLFLTGHAHAPTAAAGVSPIAARSTLFSSPATESWNHSLPTTEPVMDNNNDKIQHSINDLIEIARDGSEFYTEAASKVDNPELASLFTRMAGHKREIVNGLTADVAAIGGEPADSGTMAGSMRQAYANL